MFFVYILYSTSHDVFYKGFTENPAKRLWEHNNDLSTYTKGKGPWIVALLEEYKTKKVALIRESQIKRWNRRTLFKLIDNFKQPG
jgi:putative endonuclease